MGNTTDPPDRPHTHRQQNEAVNSFYFFHFLFFFFCLFVCFFVLVGLE